jgi:hypothetical protein
MLCATSELPAGSTALRRACNTRAIGVSAVDNGLDLQLLNRSGFSIGSRLNRQDLHPYTWSGQKVLGLY